MKKIREKSKMKQSFWLEGNLFHLRSNVEQVLLNLAFKICIPVYISFFRKWKNNKTQY